MSITTVLVAPFVGVAGAAIALTMAPAAVAEIDPCSSAVSSSRCLGPSGVSGFDVPTAGGGAANGPYGAWGSVPPLG